MSARRMADNACAKCPSDVSRERAIPVVPRTRAIPRSLDMKPLLKNLMGNAAKDQEQLEAMRRVLQDFQQERERYEALIEGSKAGADRLKKLGEPLAKTETEVEGLSTRLSQMEERFQGLVKLSEMFLNLDERAQGLAKSTAWAESRVASALEGSQKIEASMSDLVNKVDLAAELKERLTGFLEVEKPFQLLRGDAENLRGQLEGAVERMARLREQHDRLLDAHKLALSKLEAMDRRRDDIGRSLQDKERRLESVAQSVKGLDGVHQHINDVKREMVTLKALGDSVAQKTAALEAHREALDRALAQTEHLDRAMRNIDAGVRQQRENEKSLGSLAEQVTTLRALHEEVLQRSGEISSVQRQTQDQTTAMRQELASASDEMKNTIERFDFEARGLESVSQRVADLRGELVTCEDRFKALHESSLAMGQIKHEVQAVGAQLQSLSQEMGHVDRELAKLPAMRRELDATSQTARAVGEQVGRIEASRGAVEQGLRDLSQLAGAHALVHDALEQMKLAQDEMTRVRDGQSDTRSWLGDVVQSVGELREQFGEIRQLEPSLEAVKKQAQRIHDATAAIDSRREFVDELARRVAEAGSLTARLEERSGQLGQRMDAAEERFVHLGEQATAADAVAKTFAQVAAGVKQSTQQTKRLEKAVNGLQEKCESMEAVAEETRVLRGELDQRRHAVEEAAQALERASRLREESANAASQLEELAQRLTGSLAAADQRVREVEGTTSQLEDRAQALRGVERRLNDFDSRMAKWDVTEQEIARALEQIASRQGTIESLQGDLERMFAMAERTSVHVREITSVHQELEEGRAALQEVLAQLKELRDSKGTLDERRRQMAKAEDRLSRAEALLVDVQSSLAVLEGQKVLVDQAVEKAGSLQSLLRQADAAIENLREANQTTARVRPSGVIEFPRSARRKADEDDEDVARAA
jgi:chromosome segregation ATPase